MFLPVHQGLAKFSMPRPNKQISAIIALASLNSEFNGEQNLLF